MGYSVLYLAFGVVALWLLGEVLLQYKARLRWRVLAFAGFLGVVGGVYLRQVVVILLGAVAFGVGQTFVTLSYKRGFSTGWALGGRPGSSRRRKSGRPRPAPPVLEVSPVEEPAAGDSQAAAPDGQDVLGGGVEERPGGVYQPVPMQDDSGEYPLYDGRSSYTPDPYTSSGYEGYGAQGYAGWEAEPQPAAASAEATGYGVPAAGAGYDASGGYRTGGYASGDQVAGYPSGDYASGGYASGGYQDAGYAYGSGGYGGGYGDEQHGAAYQGAAYQSQDQGQGYEQQPAATSWDAGSYGSYGGFDPYAQQPAGSYAGYGYDTGAPAENPPGAPQATPPQPYIPQQQGPAESQGRPYADPYDPYHY